MKKSVLMYILFTLFVASLSLKYIVNMRCIQPIIAFSLCFLSIALCAQSPHIVIIGIDGLTPSGLQKASTPIIDSLIRFGSHTFEAKAVMPTKSSPNWASMFMGATPSKHGITSNAWQTSDNKGKRFCKGKVGQLWPSIFRLVHEQNATANIGIFHDWAGFGRLVNPVMVNVLQHTKNERKTSKTASKYLQTKPTITFIHFDNVDHAGHFWGYGSTKYIKAIQKTDKLLRPVISAIEQTNMADNTIIMIVSDHGGKGHNHGGNTPEEVLIPWIVCGKNIKANYTIQTTVNVYDTAPSIAHFLGYLPFECWEGKAIDEIMMPTNK